MSKKHSLFALIAVASVATLSFSTTADAFHLKTHVVSNSVQSVISEKIINVSDDEKGVKAQNFIDEMGKDAIAFLKDESLSQSQKEKKFRKLLRNSFDMSTIGRFALGRNWKTATDAQKKEYQKLFEDMVVEVYAARFNDYEGQKFDVSSFRDKGKKDILVTSYIVPDTGSKVQVDWRVRHKGGQYKIIDVIIEGVSMSLTQRSDFSSVIQRGGGDVSVLLAHLKEKE